MILFSFLGQKLGVNCSGSNNDCSGNTECDLTRKCLYPINANCEKDSECVAGARCSNGLCECREDPNIKNDNKICSQYFLSPFQFLIIVHIFDYDSCFRATGVNLVCLSSQLSNLITWTFWLPRWHCCWFWWKFWWW